MSFFRISRFPSSSLRYSQRPEGVADFRRKLGSGLSSCETDPLYFKLI
jgi:hypothetical protein